MIACQKQDEYFCRKKIMAVSSVSSSSDIRTDYMKLLVTQLKNQDPLEPMSNDQMTQQLTQMSQLEQLEKMSTNITSMVESNSELNSNFAKVLSSTQTNYAGNLVGKQVAYLDENGNMKTGIVEQVETVDGEPALRLAEIAIENGELTLNPVTNRVTLDNVVAVGSSSQVLLPNNEEYAKTLVDETVVYLDATTGTYKTGVVDAINTDSGNIYATVDGRVVSLDSIVSIYSK
jgi:flagellar basal-body rod modification protein FlgD